MTAIDTALGSAIRELLLRVDAASKIANEAMELAERANQLARSAEATALRLMEEVEAERSRR